MDLEQESTRATELLQGKTVKSVKRHRTNEVLIEFDDFSRLFVEIANGKLELSITGTDDND